MPDIADIAARWGAVDIQPRLIAQRENAVYEAVINGQRLALRQHRAGYQTQAAIESELRWTSRMASAGFPCPVPVAALDGRLLQVLPDGSYASAVTWIDGQAIGEGGVELGGSSEKQVALYSAVGALIAACHNATDEAKTDDLHRMAWDAEALMGNEPVWGRFWENPTLTTKEAERMLAARARAHEILTALDAPDTGLIHADCLQENILKTKDGLALIDFDDGGFGFRAYDLGTAMVQHHAHPNLEAMIDALIGGYGTLRPAPDKAMVKLFMAARGMASCGWAITRCTGDAGAQRAMADRALGCLDIWDAG